jgi:tetratricopeptide (TPR) repeat protein
MKVDDIPFDMSTETDDELRDIPVDTAQMRQGIQWLTAQLNELDENSLEAAYLLTLRGGFSRIVMDLDEAIRDLKAAHHLFEMNGKSLHALSTQIRLAHALHWKEKYVEAFNLFKSLAKSCTGDAKKYLDFVYQHHGKCLLDAGRLQEGLDMLLLAHGIRVQKGDLELIASSEKAILYARDLISARELQEL